jgi:hypothetical protein
MELTFTDHPCLPSPSDEEIVILAEKDPKLLEQLYLAHEGRIKASTDDPVRHGFDLPGWERVRSALEEFNECLALGGNRSGKTTGCAKLVMQAVSENTDGHIVCFSQNADTSVKVQQGNDAQGVQEEDQEHRGIHQLQYAEWVHWELIHLP